MVCMTKSEIIEQLKAIKTSICDGAGGGVTCVAWMTDSPNETIVERIDFMLSELGAEPDEVICE